MDRLWLMMRSVLNGCQHVSVTETWRKCESSYQYWWKTTDDITDATEISHVSVHHTHSNNIHSLTLERQSKIISSICHNLKYSLQNDIFSNRKAKIKKTAKSQTTWRDGIVIWELILLCLKVIQVYYWDVLKCL